MPKRSVCSRQAALVTPVEKNRARRARIARHGDAVSGAGGGAEGDAALTAEGIRDVVVAGYFGEAANTDAGVHGQHCVEGAADGVELDDIAERRGPAIPNGGPVQYAGM